MNKKTIIIIVILIALAIGGYFWYRNYKAKERQKLLSGVNKEGSTTVTTSDGGTGYSDAFPLGVGSRGSNVVALQIAINSGCGQLGESIAEDGVFGPQTEMATNICLAGLGGHQKGKVSYTEFQYLKNAASQDEASSGGAGASGIAAWI